MTIDNYPYSRLPLLEVISSHNFQAKREEFRLVIPLGIRTDGSIEILNLYKQPNLLVAGSVSSGKTQFINCVIASLVLCNQSDEVRLLLDDVTRVELLSFNGLPHLVRPVVIYLEDSIKALKWLDNEMTARYRQLTAVKASNIQEYNQKKIVGKPMPYLVVVIYELSDIMVGFPEMAEPLICKLARTSSDAGIHLIIATQRPTPEVFTSALKTSFPNRVCFSVISSVDSMVVLDIEGAEKLSDQGEMLYLAADESKLRRLWGFTISDVEIDNLSSRGN
jgi:S-DNA-T family DNA segregation ATPase FtsK/SpoIIIE